MSGIITLPLKDKIMQDIGFYCDPTSLLVDDDPFAIAKEAAEKLPGTIARYHTQFGSKIDQPYQPLMDLLLRIAAGKDGATLMSTYTSANGIIIAHMQVADNPLIPSREFYIPILETLKRHVPIQ
jgi:hypothetical protein